MLIGCQQATVVQDNEQDIPAAPNTPQINEQLEINREALLHGSSEQIRIKAATVLLYNESSEARQVLMDILDRSNDKTALSAVFKTLSQSRSNQYTLPNKEQFIYPLVKSLAQQDSDIAQLAAEALLLFDYDEIGAHLEKMAADTSQMVKSRLNALYALQLQPDKRAAITIVAMADDNEEQIASESRKILRTIGIPVGNDYLARQQIIYELERKSKSEFLRDWLVRQEERMRQERTETDVWRPLCLDTLDKLYVMYTDKDARSALLLGHLQAPQPERKLWALQKIYQWRVEPGEALPDQISEILIQLVSDEAKEVRLQTAKLLKLMGEISPPDKLLKQLDIEQDDEVRISLFVALGIACDYALSSDSGMEISNETKIGTLEWAGHFLENDSPAQAREGAVVIRKLLEKNGVGPDQTNKYIEILAARMNQLQKYPEAELRADLIQVMAGLCHTRSACREIAAKRYNSIFESAINDENMKIREYAVDGLIYINKQKVLRDLRGYLVYDSNPKVRARIIELAAEQGDPQDLEWLSLRIGSELDQEISWQAMTAIFLRNSADVIHDWLQRFKDKTSVIRPTSKQWKAFLTIAERKAEGNADLMHLINKELVNYHQQRGELEQAVPYLEALMSDSKGNQSEVFAGELIVTYLRLGQIQKAKRLIQTFLNKSDLTTDSGIVKAIEGYLNQPENKIKHYEAVYLLINSIKIGEERPIWILIKTQWLEQYEQLKKIKDPNKTPVSQVNSIE